MSRLAQIAIGGYREDRGVAYVLENWRPAHGCCWWKHQQDWNRKGM